MALPGNKGSHMYTGIAQYLSTFK